jgi:DNA-binding protein H-NS
MGLNFDLPVKSWRTAIEEHYANSQMCEKHPSDNAMDIDGNSDESTNSGEVDMVTKKCEEARPPSYQIIGDNVKQNIWEKTGKMSAFTGLV